MGNSGTLGTTRHLLAFPVLFLPGKITFDKYKHTLGSGVFAPGMWGCQPCAAVSCWCDRLWELGGF